MTDVWEILVICVSLFPEFHVVCVSAIIVLYVSFGIIATSNICCWLLYYRMNISAAIAEYLWKTPGTLKVVYVMSQASVH